MHIVVYVSDLILGTTFDSPSRRKVKFDDEPPVRPPPPIECTLSVPLTTECAQPVPPPAPMRKNSLNYKHSKPNQFTHGNGKNFESSNSANTSLVLYTVVCSVTFQRVKAIKVKV